MPIAIIYGLIVKIRRWLFQKNILKSYRMPVPVIIVGNITLGGTGKTPLVIAMVELLKSQGFKPGVVSRGYGCKVKNFPYNVSMNSSAADAGDEPLLIHLRTGVPVVIDPHRSYAAEYLLKQFSCDIIISDDGLQHYALQRDIEMVVIDGQRKFGNGFLFPAGPLRESAKRLTEVDFVVINTLDNFTELTVNNNPHKKKKSYLMNLIPGTLYNLKTKHAVTDLKLFEGKKLIAMAGIGNPERFFQTLEQLNLSFEKQAMPDHYQYTIKDFQIDPQVNYLMTEKDAVKCQAFATERMYYLPVSANVSPEFEYIFLEKLRAVK